MNQPDDASLRQLIKAHALRAEAPDALRERITQSMLNASTGTHAASMPKASTSSIFEHLREWISSCLQAWRPATLGVATGVLASLLVIQQILPAQATDPLPQEVASAHVRAMMADHLLDVASTDQHTVKPWFIGQLDYAPPVRDFASAGYTLVGGRVDYIAQRQVAAIIYQQAKHRINLFVWPSPQPDSAVNQYNKSGYSISNWHAGGMSYWLVSDMSANESQRFVQLLLKEK
jgi:anti-sigma factor RsiW